MDDYLHKPQNFATRKPKREGVFRGKAFNRAAPNISSTTMMTLWSKIHRLFPRQCNLSRSFHLPQSFFPSFLPLCRATHSHTHIHTCLTLIVLMDRTLGMAVVFPDDPNTDCGYLFVVPGCFHPDDKRESSGDGNRRKINY